MSYRSKSKRADVAGTKARNGNSIPCRPSGSVKNPVPQRDSLPQAYTPGPLAGLTDAELDKFIKALLADDD